MVLEIVDVGIGVDGVVIGGGSEIFVLSWRVELGCRGRVG